MQINDKVVLEGRVTGTWESTPDQPVGYRGSTKPQDVMVRVELKDKTTIDTNITNTTLSCPEKLRDSEN